MAVKYVEKGPSNIPVTGTNVSLTVIIGDAQIGGNVVQLNGEQIAKGAVTALPLGTIAEGTRLVVYTNVLDVNPENNNISITHSFTGEGLPAFIYKDTVDNNGDIYSLTATYIFV